MTQLFCLDCANWVERCIRGHKGKIAKSDVCSDFEGKMGEWLLV
jgi:hypothetical protein